jgi:hypothetical protein
MTLRLSQWPTKTARGRRDLLQPHRLIEVLPGTEGWSWQIADGHEPLELSGGEGSGYRELMSWYEAGSLVTTADLLRALTKGYGNQLIWGALRAFEQGGSSPVLTIAGFDSAWYDVDGRPDLVATLKAEFGWATVD